MSDKAQKTVRIKWIRSTIGFTHYQKRIVRSLGLTKLNQEIERPDTPQIRGIVAKVPHFVTIVEAPKQPAWKRVPEYTIHAPAKSADTAQETPAVESEKIEAPLEASATATPAEPGPTPSEPANTGEAGSGSTSAGPSPSEG